MNAPTKFPSRQQIEQKIVDLTRNLIAAEAANSSVQYRKMFDEADQAEADAAAAAVAKIKSQIAALTSALNAAEKAEDEAAAELLFDMSERVVSDAQGLVANYEKALRKVFAYVDGMGAVLQAEHDVRTDLLLVLGQSGGLNNTALMELTQRIRFSQRDAVFLAHRLYGSGLGDTGAISNGAKFLAFPTAAEDLISAKLDNIANAISTLDKIPTSGSA